jgi:FKBP-type peptidyl-prolyl cis-trans isomerase 2
VAAPMTDSVPPGAVQKGDLVLLDYELWSEFGGKRELLDTTRESAAKEAKAETPANALFRPRPYVVGRELFPGSLGRIEAALEGVVVGSEAEKEFPPSEAFGERDPDLVESFSIQKISRLPEMRREDSHLDLGTVLTIEGRSGRVSLITAGRVKVDFNRPQAGRKVQFKFKVLEKITDPTKVVTTVLDMEYGKGEEFPVQVEGAEVTIRLPDRVLFDLNWLVAKSRVIEDLRALLKVQKITFVEEHKTPAPKAPPAEASPGTSAGPSPPVQGAGATPSGAP